MRASSLSHREVINLVSRYFVPALLSRDDYGESSKSRAEDAEWRRVQRACGQHGLKYGNVCVYIIDPDGTPAATMIVTEALTTDKLIALLHEQVRAKGLKPRTEKAIAATRKPMDRAPAAKTRDGLMVHVVTRYLTNETEKGIGEDWVELTSKEWAGLVPPMGTKIGATWTIPAASTEKLFKQCYPPVCEYHAEQSKIHSSSLTGTLSAVNKAELQISLRGTLELDHSRDGNVPARVSAHFIGLATCDSVRKAITSLRLVSDEARYVFYWQNNPNPSRIAIGMESVASGTRSAKP